MIWQHYYTLSLLPALWLLWGPHRWAAAGWMGALSIALTSGIYFGLAEVLNRSMMDVARSWSSSDGSFPAFWSSENSRI